MSETPPPPKEAAFFTAIRGWNIQRGDRILGGVASGLGARIGMAPVPARLLMVLAGILLNGLVLLAYAAAWGLLPDRRGAIVIQDFGRGVTNVGALIGIAVMGIIGFVTLDNGGLFGSVFGGDRFPWDNVPNFGPVQAVAAFIAVTIPLALLGGLVFLIIYLVRRSNRGSGASGNPSETAWPSAAPVAPSAASADAAAEPRTEEAPREQAGRDETVEPSEGTNATARPAPTEPSTPSPAPASPATASAAPSVASTPQPWEPALLPGDPRAGTPSRGQGQPGATAQGHMGVDGRLASAHAYSPPSPPKPPRVPGPGKAAWLAFAGVAVLSVAAVFAIERADRLAIDPVLAWGVSLTIGLGAILVAVALSGRRLGFLGFLSVCAVLVSLPLVAEADELHDYYATHHDWWGGGVTVNEESGSSVEPTVGPELVSIREEFGDDYSAVFLAGTCYPLTDDTVFGEPDSLVQYTTVDEDTTVALRGYSTDLYVPAGTSLSVESAGGQTLVFADRNIYCDTWSDGADPTLASLTNADTPVLTLEAHDGATLYIHEEDSL